MTTTLRTLAFATYLVGALTLISAAPHSTGTSSREGNCPGGLTQTRQLALHLIVLPAYEPQRQEYRLPSDSLQLRALVDSTDAAACQRLNAAARLSADTTMAVGYYQAGTRYLMAGRRPDIMFGFQPVVVVDSAFTVLAVMGM